MSLTWTWGGNLGPNGFSGWAKFSANATIRMAVSTSASLTSPTYFSASVTNGTVYTATATGLTANTQYYYGWEEAGVLNTATVSQAKTVGAVGSQYSFTFAATGDAGEIAQYPGSSGLYPSRVSNSPGWTEVTNYSPTPQFLIHLGDMTYYWLSQNNPAQDSTYATYVDQYDAIHACANQAGTYHKIPLAAYIYDNHEYVMPSNLCDGTWSGKDNAMQGIRDRVPHYAYAENGTAGNKAVYHSFQIGRVLFMVTDNYYHADPVGNAEPRSKLGSAQMSWMTNLLQTTTAKFLVWVNSIPSNDPARTTASREWGWYQSNLADIYALFQSTGFSKRMIEITADKHRLAYGTTSIGYPIYMACPMDANDGGGEGFTESLYPNAGFHGSAYGIFKVEDLGFMIRVTSNLNYKSS